MRDGIRCSASPPVDHHPPNRNYPGRRQAAGAWRNPAPFAPLPHRSSCRHAGGNCPSRHRQSAPICGAVWTSRNCLPSSRTGFGDEQASSRPVHPEAPAIQSRSWRNRGRISAFPRKSKWSGSTGRQVASRCQSLGSLRADAAILVTGRSKAPSSTRCIPYLVVTPQNIVDLKGKKENATFLKAAS